MQSAFARYVKRQDRRWIVRFESVNYNATVWLNGRKIGTHGGAYLPFEFDLKNLKNLEDYERQNRPPENGG